MNEYGYMPGIYPGIVRSYNQERRTCRVEIPGSTDGGDVLPEAEIKYSIGDKSREGEFTTEIEILPGDTVWIQFIGGDSRYPVITGYRNPQAGNSVDWRRLHHENIEFLANQLLIILSGSDTRVKVENDFQLQTLVDVLVKSGRHFKTQSDERTQLISRDRILIRSLESRIVLQSRTGRVVI